jgi:DNA helicase-2/ATP-dependent DNA helicase PcrA
MPLTSAQIQQAAGRQSEAARAIGGTVRLIAGPGTGKSQTIEQRVTWLLSNGIKPARIAAVSFTRASATDLRRRIHRAAEGAGFSDGPLVRVSTLHALALRVLRVAGLLTHYPADPLVLDDWELEHIFDNEYGVVTSIKSKVRREEIRRNHEAFWATGTWGPPNYVPPDPAITEAERKAFDAFHNERTQVYSCVLPGELVRQCVEHVKSGTLDLPSLLKLDHLIVDEYQDLNPMDLELVDTLLAGGIAGFVAGDDDQSIYSFRFADPTGIQRFTERYPGTADHSLTDCFRCTPAVLGPAQNLILKNASGQRIDKVHNALYGGAHPPVQGAFHSWRFDSGDKEALAVAASAKALIAGGMPPREILVLLCNSRALLPILRKQLDQLGVPWEPPRQESFLDSRAGRLVLALTRIVSESKDHVAHRTLFGLKSGVGPTTCTQFADVVVKANLNYRDSFYQDLPVKVSTRVGSALKAARDTCGVIGGWKPEDTVSSMGPVIEKIVRDTCGDDEGARWNDYLASLPGGLNLGELRDLLWADTDEQQVRVLDAVFERTGVPKPEEGVLPARIRVMTMHGAKGLSAQVVFIPGLEETLFPGVWRAAYPGLVQEAARLLYVSITRARVACIASYARSRFLYGKLVFPPPSRFLTHLKTHFGDRAGGLSAAEVQAILADVSAL